LLVVCWARVLRPRRMLCGPGVLCCGGRAPQHYATCCISPWLARYYHHVIYYPVVCSVARVYCLVGVVLRRVLCCRACYVVACCCPSVGGVLCVCCLGLGVPVLGEFLLCSVLCVLFWGGCGGVFGCAVLSRVWGVLLSCVLWSGLGGRGFDALACCLCGCSGLVCCFVVLWVVGGSLGGVVVARGGWGWGACSLCCVFCGVAGWRVRGAGVGWPGGLGGVRVWGGWGVWFVCFLWVGCCVVVLCDAVEVPCCCRCGVAVLAWGRVFRVCGGRVFSGGGWAGWVIDVRVVG
jgi:hypothetical protein